MQFFRGCFMTADVNFITADVSFITADVSFGTREEITVSAVDGLSRATCEDGQAHDRPCASPIHPPPRIGTSLLPSAVPPFSPDAIRRVRFFTKKIEVLNCDR